MDTPFTTEGYRYEFSDDKSRIDVAAVHDYLANQSYWAGGRSRETVQRSIDNSYCIASYADSGELAAFARIITDWATMYYVCDLFVCATHRGRGLGKELVRTIVNHPRLRDVGGVLFTEDAHGLYSQFGFEQTDGMAARLMRKPKGD